MVIFLFAMGVFTFYVGHFYDSGVADLRSSSIIIPGCICS